MKRISITLLTFLMVSASMFAQNKLNERYAKFLSLFNDATCYAVVNIGGEEALLVSHETYNNEDSNNKPIRTALAANLYSLDSNGHILSHGELRSQGTLYPLSLSKDGIMTAGHAFVHKYNLTNNSMSLVENASITYFKDGSVKSFYMNNASDVYRDSSDDKDFSEMINTFEAATPIAFTAKKI